jgi:hypothetical protein
MFGVKKMSVFDRRSEVSEVIVKYLFMKLHRVFCYVCNKK